MSLSRPTIFDIPSVQSYLQELYTFLYIFGKSDALADPGADSILFWDDSADKTTWLTAGSGLSISGTTLTATATTSLVLLDTKTASNSASLNFTTGLDSTYDSYFFEMVDVVPQTDGAILWMRISQDTGANWKSNATDYEYAFSGRDSGSGAISGDSAGAAQIAVTRGLGNDATASVIGSINLVHPASTTKYKIFQWTASWWDDTGTQRLAKCSGAGSYNTNANAIDGVQFLMSTGNIAGGTIRLYGQSKT